MCINVTLSPEHCPIHAVFMKPLWVVHINKEYGWLPCGFGTRRNLEGADAVTHPKGLEVAGHTYKRQIGEVLTNLLSTSFCGCISIGITERASLEPSPHSEDGGTIGKLVNSEHSTKVTPNAF